MTLFNYSNLLLNQKKTVLRVLKIAIGKVKNGSLLKVTLKDKEGVSFPQ
jgi:hypothetical protein